jgi:glycosyltransferase involved in cell wall biosynthesis
LRKAKGDYVYFLDSDDEITDDCIVKLVAPLNESCYDMVVGDYTTTQGGEESMLNMESGAIMTNDKVLQTYAEGKWYVMAWNKLCNRRFLIENELYFEEGVLHEDVIWTLKVACKANSIYIENRPTYIYNIRQSSIMTSMSIEKDVSIYVKAFDCIVDFVKKENRECGKYEYQIIEGKKSGILYSLLEKGECDVYNRFYPAFYKQSYISPIDAYKKGVISLAYLIRDFHYALPMSIGCWYKKMFYNVYYRMRGKKIEGAIWK